MQVHAGRCPVDVCHGVQRLLDVFPKIRRVEIAKYRVEICDNVLWSAIHSVICVFLHQERFQGPHLWIGSGKFAHLKHLR